MKLTNLYFVFMVFACLNISGLAQGSIILSDDKKVDTGEQANVTKPLSEIEHLKLQNALKDAQIAEIQSEMLFKTKELQKKLRDLMQSIGKSRGGTVQANVDPTTQQLTGTFTLIKDPKEKVVSEKK